MNLNPFAENLTAEAPTNGRVSVNAKRQQFICLPWQGRGDYFMRSVAALLPSED
jgi:hypothetical protein